MLFKGLYFLAALTLSGSALAATTTSLPPASTTASASGAIDTATGSATGNFTFKDKYPAANSVPVPKPEWVALLNTSAIAKAPVYSNNAGPKQSGSADPYCDWTFTLCTRPDDIVECPKGQWGITYDDGPTQFSPKLYDYLDSVGQKATLFMIGGQVLQYPDLVLRAFKAGHEIAIHTFSHSYLTTQSTESIVGELKWTEQAIFEVTGVHPKLFRPPYGDIDDRVRDIAKQLGFIPVIWNHDTDDWMLGEDTSFQADWIDANATAWVNEASNATVGGVSLEHDLYSGTVDAAIRILPILKKAYDVKPVGACAGMASVYKEGNVTVSASASSLAPSSTAGSSASASVVSNAGVNGAGSSSAGPVATASGANKQTVGLALTGLVAIAAAALF
ncbi:hypothetical protein K450DRAFT_261787 [Umbelopsis ramanniana AG]|uniref:NodB homology domain-containing protein n=1 Tax=Umbelopsis ramanniana AG TaxID=1314678 RepID=A0AAD5E2Z2_UMBRA|nr:uncharacterized protein K450DRAFT_261787 [Umbelopsis ramanniana AG]KAI8575450.1 hypothetical protein K450DRAFT_261787 [Umbelopsis ramanniana AG]